MSILIEKRVAKKYFKQVKLGKNLDEIASLYNTEKSHIFDLLKQYYPFIILNELLLTEENDRAKRKS